MPPRVVITRRLPREVEARAGRDYTVVLNEDDHPLSGAEIIARCEDADALLPCVADPLPQNVLNALPGSVKIIANFGVGLDHIDLAAAKSNGLTVTNTPGVLTEATADLALFLLIGAARRANEALAEVREGVWAGWGPTHMLGSGLQGKRLGIIGLGRIGQAVAARARAFGMVVHYHARHRRPPDQEAGARFHASLEGLLAVSDILMLTCALNDETRGLIDEAALARLPKGAILVNPARGELVDDDAVIAALEIGHLGAAGLDVFRGEPALDPRYRAHPKVLALPHIGSATIETRTAMGMLALDNLDAFFKGRTPPHKVL